MQLLERGKLYIKKRSMAYDTALAVSYGPIMPTLRNVRERREELKKGEWRSTVISYKGKKMLNLTHSQ